MCQNVVERLGVVRDVLPEILAGSRLVSFPYCLRSVPLLLGSTGAFRTSASEASADADDGSACGGCDGGGARDARGPAPRREAISGCDGLLSRRLDERAQSSRTV